MYSFKLYKYERKIFMLENRDWVKSLINMRDDDVVIIPLYIQIYGQKYSLLNLDEVKKRFSPSAFKIGYGTADAWFMKNSFPVNRINDFDLIDTFNEYDVENERNIRYTVFESGDVDVIEGDSLTEEIHMYFDLLFNNVKERVDAYFKSLIESETIPFIPEDKPKKEEVPMQVGIKEYSGELSKYSSSWDPKFVNEETPEEDPLEALRKEVAEYSQDDDSEEESPFEEDPEEEDEEEASEVAFEFGDENEEDEYPRVTGEGILGQETVDFINDEGKYSHDDYLSETSPALIVETDKTGTKIVNATKVDVITDDYSTDFDIL